MTLDEVTVPGVSGLVLLGSNTSATLPLMPLQSHELAGQTQWSPILTPTQLIQIIIVCEHWKTCLANSQPGLKYMFLRAFMLAFHLWAPHFPVPMC